MLSSKYVPTINWAALAEDEISPATQTRTRVITRANISASNFLSETAAFERALSRLSKISAPSQASTASVPELTFPPTFSLTREFRCSRPPKFYRRRQSCRLAVATANMLHDQGSLPFQKW
jgi:hypothetical protein